MEKGFVNDYELAKVPAKHVLPCIWIVSPLYTRNCMVVQNRWNASGFQLPQAPFLETYVWNLTEKITKFLATYKLFDTTFCIKLRTAVNKGFNDPKPELFQMCYPFASVRMRFEKGLTGILTVFNPNCWSVSTSDCVNQDSLSKYQRYFSKSC